MKNKNNKKENTMTKKTKEKLKFFSKPTDKKLVDKLGNLYFAMDYMITSCPKDLNPMTDNGYNFWSWGVIKIGDTEIPAPYKEYGITASGRKLTLTDEQSAITNTYIFLDRILEFYNVHKQDQSEKLLKVTGPFGLSALVPAFEYFDKEGIFVIKSLLNNLKNKCFNDTKMYNIIN